MSSKEKCCHALVHFMNETSRINNPDFLKLNYLYDTLLPQLALASIGPVFLEDCHGAPIAFNVDHLFSQPESLKSRQTSKLHDQTLNQSNLNKQFYADLDHWWRATYKDHIAG